MSRHPLPFVSRNLASKIHKRLDIHDYEFKIYFNTSNNNDDDSNFISWKESLSYLNPDTDYDSITQILSTEILERKKFCITKRTVNSPTKGMMAYVPKAFERSHILICITKKNNNSLNNVLSFGLIYFPVWNNNPITPKFMVLDLICTHNDHKHDYLASKIIDKVKDIANQQKIDLFAVTSNPNSTNFFNRNRFNIDEEYMNTEGIMNNIMKYNYSKSKSKGGKYTKRMKRNTKRTKRNRRRSSRL